MKTRASKSQLAVRPHLACRVAARGIRRTAQACCTDAVRDPVRVCALRSGLAGPLDPAPSVTSPPHLTPRGYRGSAKDSFMRSLAPTVDCYPSRAKRAFELSDHTDCYSTRYARQSYRRLSNTREELSNGDSRNRCGDALSTDFRRLLFRASRFRHYYVPGLLFTKLHGLSRRFKGWPRTKRPLKHLVRFHDTDATRSA